MSYLKLGSTKVNRPSIQTESQYWDKLIVSQVIDSTCSYESPKLIRSDLDLELYYGNTFKEYDYFRELLSDGITLYLYKPISTEIDRSRIDSSYRDLDLAPEFYISDEETGILLFGEESELPKVGDIRKHYGFNIGTYKEDGTIENYKTYGWEFVQDPEDPTRKIYKWVEINSSLKPNFKGQYSSLEELPTDGTIRKKIHKESSIIIQEIKYKFNVTSNGESKWYVYVSGSIESGYVNSFIEVNYLPQIVSRSDFLTSKLNRDTLCVNRKGWITGGEDEVRKELSFYNPKYHTKSLVKDTYSESYIPSSYTQLLKLKESFISNWDSFTNGYSSYCYFLDFTQTTSKSFRRAYIVLDTPNSSGYKKQMFWWGLETDPLPLGDDVIPGASNNSIRLNYVETEDTVLDRLTMVQSFINKLKENGSISTEYEADRLEDLRYRIRYKDTSITGNNDFSNLIGLSITPDKEANQNCLSVISKGNARIEFFSKTIGKGDSDIKIRISKVDSNITERYQIVISRYSYSEVFEGNLYTDEDEDGNVEFLEYSINSNSKLVTCIIHRSYFIPEIKEGKLVWKEQLYKRSEVNDGLFEGEYILERAQIEECSWETRRSAITEFSQESSVKEDFFLINSLTDYVEPGADSSEESRMNSLMNYLLDYSKLKTCQCLIENTPERIQGELLFDGNYKYNLNDPENYLVYFYSNMKMMDNDRPGYYVFLKGISSTRGTFSTNEIIYKVPREGLLERLQYYKCNYLSCNDHEFYYSVYFSHNGNWKYNKTILMKYSLSHVTRVMERELHQFLSYTYFSDLENGINSIIRRILSDNQIIETLSLSSVNIDYYNQTLDIYLTLYIRELVEKDATLDLILNFNLT